jgi:hypothetical protein
LMLLTNQHEVDMRSWSLVVVHAGAPE